MKTIAIVACLAIVAAACGGGVEDEVAAGITERLIADPENPMTDSEAECVGTGLVADLGSARIGELGLASDGSLADLRITDAEADQMAATILECADELIVRILTEDGQLDAETAACLSDEFTDDFERELFALVLKGVEPGGDQLNGMLQAMLACDAL